MTLVEAAVDTLQSALIAERAGAMRVELCASLHDGGITPSAGLISAVVERVAIPVFVMIRPRGGAFVYSSDEVAVMRRDIEIARREKAHGVVIGALDSSGRIDVPNTRDLVKAARELPVTFHRAFDLSGDLPAALDQLIEIGVARVLTSGGAPMALDGADVIARLVDQSRGRIIVMAGGGVRENNVRQIVARTGVSEVHARISSEASSGDHNRRAIRLRKPFPQDENVWEELDAGRMRALVDLADTSEQPGES